MKNRLILTQSTLFKSFESKGKSYDLSMLDKDNFIKLNELESVLNEIQMRNFPLTPMIMHSLEMGRIVLTRSKTPGSSIQIIPAVNDSGRIERVFVNCSLISKMVKSVDSNTGDIKEVTTVKSYEELYNILLGAFVALNTEKIINNMSVFREIAESYIDIVAQIISRSMGNPMDGDKMRFLIKVFFYNGIMTGEELANVEKYNVDSARVLSTKYPDFFAATPKSLTDFIEVIGSEFNSLKNVTVEAFIGEAVKTLGSNAVFFIDNYPYMLSVMTVKMRKDRSGVYNGYILRVLDPYARKMLSEIQRAVI